MSEIVKQLPDIITSASASPLGIVALILILFSSLAYGFFRKSNEKWKFAALALFFIGSIAFGFAMFRSAGSLVTRSEVPARSSLEDITSLWVEVSEKARTANTISPGRQLPTDLIAARNEFERAWRNDSLIQKTRLPAEKVSKALSNLNRLYRIVEKDSSTQTNSNIWADEAISFFEEIRNPQFLTEALLDKAAIYLDIAQLGHNDRIQFERMAREGDSVMSRAYQTSDSSQRPVVLRISSRFYYNLARPQSFRLSDKWDNNYLLLAYEKAREAYKLAPDDSKNANQLARTVIKVSKNPPQDHDRIWVARLRESQVALKKAWNNNQSKLVGLDQRLSPLNVLGVITLETVAREWAALDLKARKVMAARLVEELDEDALSPLREAVALLQNSELRKSYGFDLYYDVARATALKTALLRTRDSQRASEEFSNVKSNLVIAKENAKTSQLEAAVRDISREITFSFLSPNERVSLVSLLAVGAK